MFGSQGLPMMAAGFGLQTPFGMLLPPGGRLAGFVRSTGPQPYDEPTIGQVGLYTNLNDALSKCRAGMNDTVMVLPGHTQNLSTADALSSLKAGTRIVSAGRPGASNNPTLNWTATAATFLLDVADVTLMGFNLNFAGIDAVVAPITISATGCALLHNHCTVAAGSAGATTPITVAAGANNCLIAHNKMLSTGTETQVNIISVTGAVDNLEICYNRISCLLTSATGGIIQLGAAATNLDIHDNLFYNAVEDGICIRMADTFAATGWVYYNLGKTIDAGGTVANTAKMVSFEGTTESLLGCFENRSTDEATASGALSPAVATT